MTWISYAQNFEDVILMRALGHMHQGFYIDVGAQDPSIDSVSRAFYERGWRGIHVEPVPFYAESLRRERPGDLVVEAVLGVRAGRVGFHEFSQTGLSTAVVEIAQAHIMNGFSSNVVQVEQKTLSSIFDLAVGQCAHWLKIDVEGSETSVLKGWLSHASRPWVVVVESTFPLSQRPTHLQWEGYLSRRGYSMVYFDGLNRFYLHSDHCELRHHFRHGPCVFDDFALSGLASAPFCLRPRIN